MTPLVYVLPGYESLGAALLKDLGADRGDISVRRFPDGESYIRLLTAPKGRAVIFVCGLDRPNDKSIELYFAACAAHELGAASIGVVAPYLAYMRQDARFNEGEAITSVYFAKWVSQFADWLVTVDPHLHRHSSLDGIYSIPSVVVSSTAAISHWIRTQVSNPLIVGPDAESAQWVEQIAARVGCPVVVLHKERLGDHEVRVSLPDIRPWRECTPVLVDDIVSTARTMLAAIAQLRAASMQQPPVCIGVHALFSADAHAALLNAGIGRIVTCNTVKHPSNAIDVFPDIANAVRSILQTIGTAAGSSNGHGTENS